MPPRARLLLASLALLLPFALVPTLPAQASGDWRWPVDGELVTAYRNGGDPYAGGQHRGIDVAAEPGTAVRAAAAGTVRFAGVAGSSGLTVSVRTTDGRYDTSYLHLSKANVHEGDVVGAGEELGASGVTGRRSSERPHLHFGVREAGSRHAYVDPLDLLGPPPAQEATARPAPGPVKVSGPVPASAALP
ncbi:MAG: murein hydrolase activator EnvC family protein, partial [Thermoleophilaceae bacterium]